MSETMDPMATETDQQELAQPLLAQASEWGINRVGLGRLRRLRGAAGRAETGDGDP